METQKRWNAHAAQSALTKNAVLADNKHPHFLTLLLISCLLGSVGSLFSFLKVLKRECIFLIIT
jgi:hypothetical protein